LIGFRKNPRYTAGVNGKAIKKMIYRLSYVLGGPKFVSKKGKEYFSFFEMSRGFLGIIKNSTDEVPDFFRGYKAAGDRS